MKLTRFRTQYDETSSVDPGIACTLEERKTKSEFAQECDVNLLIARWKKTGIAPQALDASKAVFGDFSQVPTRTEMHDLVSDAYDAFGQLPAEIRREFNNDPRVFVASSETPSGMALLVKHGLATVAAPTPSPASPEAGQAAPSPTEPVKKA